MGKYGFIHISSDPDTGLVSGMGYYSTLSSPIYLENILTYYGEPDYVDANDIPGGLEISYVRLFYDEFKTIVDLGEVINVSEDTEVSEIFFLNPKEYLEEEKLTQLPWKGYGDYP